MIKNIITSAAVALVVAIGALVVFAPTAPAPTHPVGSVSSPDISSPYISVNNLQTWGGSFPIVQNSSTTCQYLTPAATTTLTVFNYRFGLASTSAVIVEMGKSAAPNATTTLFGTTFNIAGGAQATVEASSTAGGAGDLMVLAPSTYLVVKLGGGGVGSVPTGSCDFEVQVLP